MKKVLIISASPRKGGNSDTLCNKFMFGAREAGHDVEKIFLRDKKINYCVGCGLCTTNDYTACSQKDDMDEILEKMLTANVIVLATPVYFYAISGQMKTFIDRCCSRYTRLSNKEFYFIATAADPNRKALENTFNDFRGFTSCLEGAKEKGCIYGCGVWAKDDITRTQLLDEAYHMGLSV